MTQLTLTEAAAATGRSKSTIHRAVKAGRLSAHRDAAGTFHLDASELHRVFPPDTGDAAHRHATARHDEPRDTVVAVLETKVAMLQDQLERERDQVAHLRQLLERAEGRALAHHAAGASQGAGLLRTLGRRLGLA